MSKGSATTTQKVTIPEEFKPYLLGGNTVINAQGSNTGVSGSYGGYGGGVNPDAPNQPQMVGITGLLPEASKLFAEGGFGGYTPMSEGLKQGIDEARLGISNLKGLGGSAQGLYNEFAGLDLINSPVTEGIINRSTGELQRQLTEGVLPTIGDAALQAGQFGSSRQGVAEGVATNRAQQSIADVTASILGNAQAQELTAKNAAMNFTPMLAQLLQAPGQQSLGLGQLEQEFATAQSQQAANNIKAYTQLISSLIPGANTSGSTDDPNEGVRNAAGLAMAAYALYSMSDKRLKTNIAPVGQVGKVRFYRWKWNETAKKVFGLVGEAYGVIAQELEKIMPEALGSSNGFKTVNYSKVWENLYGH